ncbi:MAG: ribbon-helix-helix domain-containing protein [Rhizobiaceae bacterium]|nr:ribbon-helix-helix domain-containing protein [Rhizobiaceae bacterium]
MLRKHSVSINGHRTSFSIEDPFMDELRRMARRDGKSLSQLITQVDNHRDPGQNLSSSLRLLVLDDLTASRS